MGRSEIEEIQLQESIAASFIIFQEPVFFPPRNLGSGYNIQKVRIRTVGRQLSTPVIGYPKDLSAASSFQPVIGYPKDLSAASSFQPVIGYPKDLSAASSFQPSQLY